MYNTLSSLLQRPAPYEKTQQRFWTDPHISQGMLDAHLDPNTDAASRKPESIARSVEWICTLLPHQAKLLDIGCGPGLYTKRLSERGLCVTGLDFSERSIAYAKAHDPKSVYVTQDYLELEYENEFDMITMIWCDYGALNPQDRQNLLVRIHRALKPGGLFLFDVFSLKWLDGRQQSTSWEVYEHGGFWSRNPHICLKSEYHYRNHIGVERYVILEKDVTRCYNIWNTCFSKQSLSKELLPQGFAAVKYYADVEGNPFEEHSTIIGAIAEKR